jgi:hypothetical protein
MHNLRHERIALLRRIAGFLEPGIQYMLTMMTSLLFQQKTFLAVCLTCLEAASTAVTTTGFTLIDAATDIDLIPLQDGDVIDIATDGPSLTIRADVVTDSDDPVVKLDFDYGSSF